MLPQDVASTVTYSAAFLSPRDRVFTRLLCWERGGVALNDGNEGLDVYDWRIRADSETGAVYFGVPVPGSETEFTVAETLVYTIDPLPVEVSGSFDTNMQPIIAWRDINGESFFRWYDPIEDEFTVVKLPYRTHSMRLAIDDVRRVSVLAGITDTILAYVRGSTLYYRQLRDRFADEYNLGGGFPSLYNVGMNNLLRFQFARSPVVADGDPELNYLLLPSRAGKLAGFDEEGNAAFYDFTESHVDGATGPAASATKLMVTENGQAFFLRAEDGTWQNTTFDVQIDFYLDYAELRGSRTLTFTRDAEGRITRETSAVDGEVSVRIVETGVGTRTYTATLYPRDSGAGITFSLISAFGLPTTGEFLPLWNANGDFYGGGLVPTALVHYTDYGTFATLRLASDTGNVARSATTRMRWGAGSLPVPLRPATARTVPCSVSNDGVTVAGLVQFNTDGSAEFWPLTTDTQLVKGEFVRTTAQVRQKGLPLDWQLTYVKAGPSLYAPIPTLVSVSPDPFTRFDTGVTATLTGTGFRANSVVRIDGVPVSTTFNDTTELEATVPDAVLEDAGTLSFQVFTPTPGGGLTAAIDVDVENPVPVIASLVPDSVEAGDGDTALTVNGTGFVPESVITFDGTPLTTTFVDDTELTATIPSALIANSGTVDVDVTNPTPGGGTDTESFDVIGLDIQIFTSSGTWNKPVGAVSVEVICIGGGGGGGRGVRGSATNNKSGGGGGGGGGLSIATFAAGDLGSSETVTVGTGGAGAPSSSSNNNNGAAGSAGGASSFGAHLTAGGGGAGGAGATSTNRGLGGTGTTENGSVGGEGNSASAGGAGGNSTLAPSGGGAGGGRNSSNVGQDGGAGGNVTGYSLAGGAGGVAANGSPGNATGVVGEPGSGGGGGGASTQGLAGGDGGSYGAGGGGSSASNNSAGVVDNSGGDGADGIVIVITSV